MFSSSTFIIYIGILLLTKQQVYIDMQQVKLYLYNMLKKKEMMNFPKIYLENLCFINLRINRKFLNQDFNILVGFYTFLGIHESVSAIQIKIIHTASKKDT